MTRKYPDYVLKMVRQYFGLEANDTSDDDEFNNQQPSEIFRIVTNWDGLINYDIKIKSWIEAIYGFDIDEVI